MKRREFINKNKAIWDQLEQYIKDISKHGLKSQDSNDLTNLLSLYRKVLSDISYAKTNYSDPDLIMYLNSLATKSHNLLFSSSSVNPLSFVKFIFRTFPKVIQNNLSYVLLSTLVFTIGTIVAYLIVILDIPSLEKILPAIVTQWGEIPSQLDSDHLMSSPLLTSVVMTNNLRVSFLAISTGFLFGLGPIYVLWHNGLMLGGIAALFHMAGHNLYFWATVLPHGVIELPAIFLAGAAGLIIGKSLLLPGNYSRAQSLKKVSNTIFHFLSGVILLLIIAAIIEGYYSPMPYSEYSKLIFSAIALVLLGLYLGFPRKRN